MQYTREFDENFFCSQLSDLTFMDFIPDGPLKYNAC